VPPARRVERQAAAAELLVRVAEGRQEGHGEGADERTDRSAGERDSHETSSESRIMLKERG